MKRSIASNDEIPDFLKNAFDTKDQIQLWIAERRRRYPSKEKVVEQLDRAEKLAHELAEKKRKKLLLDEERKRKRFSSFDVNDASPETLKTITDSKIGTGTVTLSSNLDSTGVKQTEDKRNARKQQRGKRKQKGKRNERFKGNGRKLHLPRKRPSLLDKLTQKEKNEEICAFMQCLRYMVEKDFFRSTEAIIDQSLTKETDKVKENNEITDFHEPIEEHEDEESESSSSSSPSSDEDDEEDDEESDDSGEDMSISESSSDESRIRNEEEREEGELSDDFEEHKMPLFDDQQLITEEEKG
ncbi:uncharacterized protein MONOS_2510 [Monocercomonoides exilis]|uniref:uncharacterized protein n=1 Tax=Monocercomonoides exilis TaxID=2049356 RepID=UPI00355A7FC7|nr:hypothetical protein MONOS_2510 [Monocercomonoides exilis]|eukprot:MONOS_2510.1-p1 / transcript=MONOS_2510.1 / gene=MONOS_2510 / organism=Monocercomonoides_exilis_PA203 / gene_product=unspecified product / transcript_product=unspecified product / location=Mono_scaffold00052:74916-75964(-) / protein_length=298 / sequence_SO=supercontig / SO=protein_coding / is_pseudo=false